MSRPDNYYQALGNKIRTTGTRVATTSRSPVNASNTMNTSHNGSSTSCCAVGQCAVITSDNKVLTWGNNNFSGQLGQASQTENFVPTDISNNGSFSSTTVKAISFGYYHAVAIDEQGNVHSWGDNFMGALGVSEDLGTQSFVPCAISNVSGSSLNGRNMNSIAVGAAHTLALDTSGLIHAWGDNYYGAIGPEELFTRPIPEYISNKGSLVGKNINKIYAGFTYSAAIDTIGNLHVWGGNIDGQLGLGNNEYYIFAPTISNIGSITNKRISKIACGRSHMLILANDGSLHACGSNAYGELGDDTVTSSSNVPIRINSWDPVIPGFIVDIAASFHASFIIDNENKLYSWGSNSRYELGIVVSSTSTFVQPTRADAGSLKNARIVMLGTASHLVTAIDTTGKLHLWGSPDINAFFDDYEGPLSYAVPFIVDPAAMPEPTPGPTSTPTQTPIPTQTLGPNGTPTPTPTPTPTIDPNGTPTPTHTPENMAPIPNGPPLKWLFRGGRSRPFL